MLSFLFRSQGSKRQIAAILSALLGVAEIFPGAAQITVAVQWLASAFGVTGLVHASAAGTIFQNKLPGIVAILSTLIALAHFVPSLAPLVGPMQHLAALLGAASVGSKLSSK